jgi:hypothetical protein
LSVEEDVVYVHIVLSKLKEPSEESFGAVEEAFQQHLPNIPGLARFEIGRNFSESNNAYDLAIVAWYESKDDLLGYYPHEEHLAIGAAVRSLIEKNAVIDYEV